MVKLKIEDDSKDPSAEIGRKGQIHRVTGKKQRHTQKTIDENVHSNDLITLTNKTSRLISVCHFLAWPPVSLDLHPPSRTPASVFRFSAAAPSGPSIALGGAVRVTSASPFPAPLPSALFQGVPLRALRCSLWVHQGSPRGPALRKRQGLQKQLAPNRPVFLACSGKETSVETKAAPWRKALDELCSRALWGVGRDHGPWGHLSWGPQIAEAALCWFVQEVKSGLKTEVYGNRNCMHIRIWLGSGWSYRVEWERRIREDRQRMQRTVVTASSEKSVREVLGGSASLGWRLSAIFAPTRPLHSPAWSQEAEERRAL